FITNAILFGPSYAFPLLFQEITEEFGITNSDLAWLFPVYFLFSFMFGPFYNATVNLLGLRLSHILATLLWSSSMFAAFFINGLFSLLFFIGVLPGISVGIQVVTTTEVIIRYFDKNFSLALALSTCGIGCGGFIFPAIVGFISSQNSWRFVFFTLGVIQLQSIVTGASFGKPAPKTGQMSPDEALEREKSNFDYDDEKENFFQRICFNVPTLSLSFGTIFHFSCNAMVATFLIPMARIQ
ncbi:hypothetical protein Ciccas_012620, partial [Cichlidogyrus casuarinus]